MKLLGAVDARRYVRAVSRVEGTREDHEERGSKDRAANTCGAQTVTRPMIRANVGAVKFCSTNNFQTPCRSKSQNPSALSRCTLLNTGNTGKPRSTVVSSPINVECRRTAQAGMLSDESRFVLGTDDNCVRMWRHPGELVQFPPTLFYVTLPAQLV
ncbi:hypothetical protein TNCV_1785871 [Trichonephila clavipes]|nr:hypothetical protein TNCV_1785871 [Trichonephila clavipes]